MENVNIFPVVVKRKEASFHFFSQMKKGVWEEKNWILAEETWKGAGRGEWARPRIRSQWGLRILIGSSAGDTWPQGIILAEALLFRYFVTAWNCCCCVVAKPCLTLLQPHRL